MGAGERDDAADVVKRLWLADQIADLFAIVVAEWLGVGPGGFAGIPGEICAAKNAAVLEGNFQIICCGEFKIGERQDVSIPFGE